MDEVLWQCIVSALFTTNTVALGCDVTQEGQGALYMTSTWPWILTLNIFALGENCFTSQVCLAPLGTGITSGLWQPPGTEADLHHYTTSHIHASYPNYIYLINYPLWLAYTRHIPSNTHTAGDSGKIVIATKLSLYPLHRATTPHLMNIMQELT